MEDNDYSTGRKPVLSAGFFSREVELFPNGFVPERQPYGPPNFDQLRKCPTSKAEGSENFVTRTPHSGLDILTRASEEMTTFLTDDEEDFGRDVSGREQKKPSWLKLSPDPPKLAPEIREQELPSLNPEYRPKSICKLKSRIDPVSGERVFERVGPGQVPSWLKLSPDPPAVGPEIREQELPSLSPNARTVRDSRARLEELLARMKEHKLSSLKPGVRTVRDYATQTIEQDFPEYKPSARSVRDSDEDKDKAAVKLGSSQQAAAFFDQWDVATRELKKTVKQHEEYAQTAKNIQRDMEPGPERDEMAYLADMARSNADMYRNFVKESVAEREYWTKDPKAVAVVDKTLEQVIKDLLKRAVKGWSILMVVYTILVYFQVI